MEETKNEIGEKSKTGRNLLRSKKIALMIAAVGCVLLIGVCVFGIVWVIQSSAEGKVKTVSHSTLEKLMEIGDLSTLQYDYASVAVMTTENGEECYYVAYEGTVWVGIDFSSVRAEVDKQEKKVIFTLPEAKVCEVMTDVDSFDFIFVKDRFETETILPQAHALSLADLKQKAENDNSLLTMARKNAEEALRALAEPLLKAADERYTVEVR